MPAACGVQSASHQGIQDFRMMSSRGFCGNQITASEGQTCGGIGSSCDLLAVVTGWFVPGTGTLRADV